MSGLTAVADAMVLAHHPIVDALPAVIPMVVLVGAFVGIVVADRRRSREEPDDTAGTSTAGTSTAGTAETDAPSVAPDPAEHDRAR